MKASFAQKQDSLSLKEQLSTQNEVFTIVEEMPEYHGGMDEFRKFVQSNLKLPNNISGKEINGKCVLRFIVDTTGVTRNFEVLKGVTDCPECDVEGLRVLKLMPKWKPGSQNGRAVAVFFNIPITFNMPVGYKATVNSKCSIPVFKGGSEEMMKFIYRNKIYSKEQKEKGLIGISIVRFYVDSTGKVGQVSIRQSSLNKEFDSESIRLVSMMPNWIPAIENGKRINKYCDLQITFGDKSKLEKLKKNQYDLSNKFFSEGMKEFQAENMIEAKNNYKKAYELNCYHTDALYNLGVSYFKLNQKDSACFFWSELKTNFAKQEADVLIRKYCTN